MRWTRSRDGVLRATVRLEHRVDRDALIAAVMYAACVYGEDVATRGAAEAALRRMLDELGRDWSMRSDDTADDNPEALDAAVEIVSTLFPELVPSSESDR